MNRQPRDYVPHLSAEYALQHPQRPPKTDFSDEVLAATAFLMRQIDPDGTKGVVCVPMPAEDYVPDSVVKPTGRSGARAD